MPRIGVLMTHAEKDRRRVLARYIVECEGNLLKTAWRMGYNRSHMYRLVEQFEMWPLINEVRVRRTQRDWKEGNKDMAYKMSEWGFLRAMDPEKFDRDLLAKFREHGGNSTRVARDCGVALSTLKRWVALQDLRGRVEAIRAKVSAKTP